MSEAKPKESLLTALMPVIVLTVICAVSGTALAALKIATADRIELQLLANVQGPALAKMFPQASNDPITERRKFTRPDGGVVTAFPIYENNKLTAVALEGIGTGYGGELGALVAFNPDNGSINRIGISVFKETPGIGSKILTGRFLNQFNGRSDVALRSEGGEIDGVSGASFSSKGAVTGVQQAIAIFGELKGELVKAWPEQM